MGEREDAMGQMLGGLTGGLLGGGGWLMFAIFAWQLPWFWSATFNDSCWWLPLALLLTVLAVGPLLVGLGVGLDGVRKVKLASIPPQFRNQVTEFRGDEDSWSQIESTFSAASGHIEKGSKGEDVRFLQQRLNEFGAEIGVDGSFGNQTDRAVRNFQTDHGLTVDGIVGPKTMAALQRTVNKHHEEHLEKGSSGDEVRKLQELLNEHGASLSVDGSFGDLTYREVVKFQTDNGLTVDGVVGSQTWGALTKSEKTDSESDGGPSISLNKDSFGPQELIAVTFENGPGNPSDWIGIYRKEAPSDGENHHGNWIYANGSGAVFAEAREGPRNGTVTFSDGMGEGGYEARFFANNGYGLLASAPFEVSIDDGPTEEESEEIQLLKQMREAGRSADECRLAGFSAEQCRDAGYSADELLELCFPPYGEPRVYNWNGYQGSNIICEGKFGILTFVHPGYPEDIRVEYLDGSTNSVNTHAECLATDGYGSPSIERGSVRLLRWDVEIEVEPEVFMESDSELADITGELEVVASAIEELAEDPDASIDELRALADSHLEERMSGLSNHQKDRLRGVLWEKMNAIEEKARGRISSDSGVSKGIAAAGAAAAITAAAAGWAATHRVPERIEEVLEDGEVGLDEVREQVSEIIEVEQEPELESEPAHAPDETVESQPESTSISNIDGTTDEFIALSQEIGELQTYSEQLKMLKPAMDRFWDLTVQIEQVERTMRIGIEQEYRYGKTVIGKVGDSEVAIAFPESRNEEIESLQSGQKGVIRARIMEYQSVIERFDMLSS